MATINFPANPQLNDTYTFLGRTWIYNGIGWVVKPDDITAFVNKGGDTMSGKLTITSGGLSVSGTTSLEAIETSSQTLVDNLNADFLDGQEGAFYRNASNLNAGTLALLYGGTGSTTAAGARTNLGAAALAGSSTQDFSTQNLTVSGTTYNMLTLSRTTANGASILFQNSSGNLGKLGFDGSGNLIIGKGTTTDGAADLLKITPAGVTTFYNSVTASSFIKSGGTSSQFLKADGTVDSNAYLPLTGGELTRYLSINTPNSGGSSYIAFKRGGTDVGYVGDGTSGANTDIVLHNYISSKGLALGNDGILRYGGNFVWHAGNDGHGSGLDADTIDGLHAKVNGGGGEAWGYIPVVATDGTMQVGRYLDFNHSSGIGVDYNARLHTNGVTDGELYINSNRIWHAGNLNLSTYFTYRGSFTSSSNMNDVTDMGMWLNTTGNGSGNSNFPAQYGYIQTFSRGVENYSRWQMSVDNTADNIHIRAEWAGTWGGWKKLWHSANDGSGSGLDADMLDGLHSSNFFKVILNNTTSVNDYTFWENSAGKLYNTPDAPYNYYSFLSFGQGIYQTQFNGYNNSLKFRSGSESGLINKPWAEIYHSQNSNISTIDWSTKDLTVSGVINFNSAGNQINTTSAIELALNYAGGGARHTSIFDGQGNFIMRAHANGNVGIGTSEPQYKLDVNGTGRFSDTLLTNNIIFNSNNTWGNLGSVRCTWGNDGGYPTLYGSTAERWIMHINPHISYVQNGIGEYTGAMNGATIRFAGNYGATTSWDLGVGCNSVGSDKFSVGRFGSSFVSIDNSGNMSLNGYLSVAGGDDVVGIKNNWSNTEMYFGTQLKYKGLSGISEYVITSRLYNVNPISPTLSTYNKIPMVIWHGRIQISSTAVYAASQQVGSITLTGTRVGTGTATLTMYSINGGVLPASKTDYMVVGTGMGTSDTSTSCSFVTIPDSHKYSNSFRIMISDDSTPNDGYAEIMIIQIKEPGSYPS